MNEKQIKVLSDAPVTQAIFKMSLPVVFGMMVQVFYNLVDTFFIGRLNDPNQLAAANITTPIFMILMAVAGIVGTGAASYISRNLGEKNYETAHRTLSTGVAIIVGLSLLMTIIGLSFLSVLVNALGADQNSFPFAYSYSFVLILSSVFIMGNYAMGQLLRSEGAAMASMVGMMIGIVANVILDPIFIFGFNMGIKGAAIATVLGNALALVFYIVYYAKGKSAVKFGLRYICIDKVMLGQIFGIGIPASLSQLLMSVSLIICNNLAVAYGNNVVAGMGIANKIMTIGTFVFMGFAAGTQPLVGFNYGAKNYKRVKEIIKKGMVITVSIGFTLFVVFGVFANGLIGIFSKEMPEVVANGAFILRALMWSLLVLGPQMITTTTVQAFGKAKASLFLAVVRQGFLFIPLLFILNYSFGFNGLIYAQPISDVLITVIAVLILKKLVQTAEEKNKQ